MRKRRYYADRHQLSDREEMDYEMLKKLFLNIYKELEQKFYFQLATGKDCVTEEVIGEWGYKKEAFFFEKLGKRNIWPFSDNIDYFEESLFFSLIELLYDYVKVPTKKSYHSHYNCGYHVLEGDKEKGKQEYREKINGIIKDYQKGYELTLEGEIREIPPSGLIKLVKNIPKTSDPDNIDNRVQNAVNKYLKYDSSLIDKNGALLELGKVLEFLKKSNVRLAKKDDSTLFHILNKFDLRHLDQLQHTDYSKDIWFDWFFYTFLASIDTRLKFVENGNTDEN